MKESDSAGPNSESFESAREVSATDMQITDNRKGEIFGIGRRHRCADRRKRIAIGKACIRDSRTDTAKQRGR